MTYNKPDITVLGDAASLILGETGAAQESTNKAQANGLNTDGDLDD